MGLLYSSGHPLVNHQRMKVKDEDLPRYQLIMNIKSNEGRGIY